MSTVKPSATEEEYFAREEAEKKRTLALAQAKSLKDSERENLKKLHAMHCPKCGMSLYEISIHGVNVDKCFSCHGIYLDEGELEKLVGATGYWSKVLQFFARRDYSHE